MQAWSEDRLHCLYPQLPDILNYTEVVYLAFIPAMFTLPGYQTVSFSTFAFMFPLALASPSLLGAGVPSVIVPASCYGFTKGQRHAEGCSRDRRYGRQ